MSEKNAPAPSERCDNCGRPEGDAIHDEEYERGGHNFFHTPPAPAPAPSGVLSAEGVKDLLSCLQISMLYMGKKHIQNREDSRAKLLAHDAALRAEVERLTKERDATLRELTSERQKTDDAVWELVHEQDAIAVEELKAANARLREALREIGHETTELNVQDIARKALEEK